MFEIADLNDEVKELLKNLGVDDEVETIDDFIDFHYKRFFSKVTRATNIEDEDPIMILFIFLQASLYRSRMYLHGYVTAINDRNLLMAVLAARAHIEVLSSLGYLLNMILTADSDFKKISFENLEKLILGSRKKSLLPDGYPNHDSINVLTMIDTTDKVISTKTNEPKTSKQLRESYEILSELCHPNSLGTALAVEISNQPEAYDFQSPLNTLDDNFIKIIHHKFVFSIKLFKLIYNELAVIIANNQSQSN